MKLILHRPVIFFLNNRAKSPVLYRINIGPQVVRLMKIC